MKMTYITPKIELHLIDIEKSILAGSVVRGISGGPTTTEGKTLPSLVGETDDDTDPYGGHGVGTGNSGNRANTGLWDD